MFWRVTGFPVSPQGESSTVPTPVPLGDLGVTKEQRVPDSGLRRDCPPFLAAGGEQAEPVVTPNEGRVIGSTGGRTSPKCTYPPPTDSGRDGTLDRLPVSPGKCSRAG